MENIVIRFKDKSPLYYQLYYALATRIRSGDVAARERLPSKRRMALSLDISVNTVDTAYQMLVAEGYIEPRAKSGFYACKLESTPLAPKRAAAPPADNAKADESPQILYDFTTSGVDTTLFPFKVWSRIQREVLYTQPQLLNLGDRQGDEDLREAICIYLREYRGVVCDKGQLIVGAGIEYLLSLLALLFAHSTVAVEDPGYTRAERVLRANGVHTVYLPLDSAGLSCDALRASGAQCAYITPSHQFPSGITMPMARRLQLLQWASETADRYLIEDDYGSEFRFDSRPIPSLQGMDEGGKVVYIGTFSKSVAPSIRIAYMVLPPCLLARYHAELGFYSSTVSRFEQQTLCRFIAKGHFARHLGRLRLAYRMRRDALVSELSGQFGKGVTLSGTHTGLHLLASFKDISPPSPDDEAQIAARAAQRGLRVSGLSGYYHSAHSALPPTLVLGYAALSEEELRRAVGALAQSIMQKK